MPVVPSNAAEAGPGLQYAPDNAWLAVLDASTVLPSQASAIAQEHARRQPASALVIEKTWDAVGAFSFR